VPELETEDPGIQVFEVIERRQGVTQQDPDRLISHGLFSTRYRANVRQRRLRAQGVLGVTIVIRQVN
jgi:hypothetical protein